MRPPLILWQDHVCGLAYAGRHPFDGAKHQTRLLAFSIAFASTCKGMTGRDCWLPPSLLERVPQRTATRYLSVLRDAGLVEQTAAAAPGRAARYRLVVPDNAGQNPARNWRASAVHQLASVRAQGENGRDAVARTTLASSEHRRGCGGQSSPAHALRIAA